MHKHKSDGHAMQKWMNYSIFGKNDLLTPVTPYDPRLPFDPTKWIEDLKLMYMYEFYVQAIRYGRVRAFLVKLTS